MAITKIISITSALALSVSVNAAIISVDWQSAGDNLITRDTETGLNWLDLTVTNGMSFNTVNGQLGSGGLYEGFRYATGQEVVDLYAKFGVTLTAYSPNFIAGPVDPGIVMASDFLGTIVSEYSTDFTYGGKGMYDYGANLTVAYAMGAWYFSGTSVFPSSNVYFDVNYENSLFKTDAEIQTGSFLVQQSAVPVPAAVWLFGSGLIGLLGIARKKART